MKYSFLSLALNGCILLLTSTTSCNRKGESGNAADTSITFSGKPTAHEMDALIPETSGIADSKINPGFLWVEEDSGNPPRLYLINHAASSRRTVYIKGAVNTDWEDIALGNGPLASKQYLYIADIGDNNAVRTSVDFYRLEEPAGGTDTVRVVDRIRFVYEDGPRDAEAFLMDEQTKDIYIITKRDLQSKLYKLTYPYSASAMNTAVFLQSFPYNGVVSAAAGSDNKGILIKTYPAMYYYARKAGESIPQTLQKNFSSIGYQQEPQGEAVCFAADNSGFYTLSEKGNASTQSLYFYLKK